MAEDSYRVMGVCVWEGDVMICHALHFRTMGAAAARLTCHIPYTAVSNSYPEAHQSQPSLFLTLSHFYCLESGLVAGNSGSESSAHQTRTCITHMSTKAV